ncbi:cytochrome c oxidase subunit 1 [Salinibacter ruber]|jgi:cytochrome c oxidase subunit 1|uniref:Cytochrome c oxidase subunit 1 n=3 Tax=Salinibacter ruber TaxID=146919 RepID=Q2S0S6_SALRD|nr:cytochrome c oxidase subunit I [Salinibacter ruber]ABC44742.1 cytochrome oxidase subunit I [Salinibacter ruber DSM 13855]MCS3664771.1 cytochrome c oxidase subunit 1 [Salinibacter ruber]MCS3701277.1 cytochrome c oxidase subunit 1 [Salinibacter ruber]MCS3704390.1 cytochrome c oxidase subunit 1 [Salinibacter ruber]MCS3751105.1 cytochrome c oxidase subunit 1 [Salinibacter ruber]
MSTTTQNAPVEQGEPQEEETNYLNHETSIWSWLSTKDHKRIGVLYCVSLATVFLAAGVLALLMRAELSGPDQTLMSNDTYNQVFTMHGILMVFLFLVPSIPAILGNFVLPLQIGAKDVAFPRLNLASWYVYLAGAALTITALLTGGVDTGWTFYTPYSSSTGGGVLWMTAAIFVAGFANIFTGMNFIVTIHKMRAPGMTWNRLPLFVWGLYATSIVQVLATPVIGITMVLLILEQTLQIGIFDPALGGDPVLFQHFFWFYSHPAVYIMILPAFGILSELIATFSRSRIFGYRAIALSSVAIAMLGFLVWGHHMFVSGQSAISSIVFSLITYLIGIPSGIKVFNWVATLYKGSIWLQTPMLYALGFLFMFTIGGFTGIMVGVLSVDVHLHDTYYVVGHFHYVMMGGSVVALLGGMHYWWPKITGRMYNETLAKIAAALVFIGFNLTFFPQLVLGSRGMPRRYANYADRFAGLHQLSTYGSQILGVGLFLILGYALWSLAYGEKAPANPWGATTLEWTNTTAVPIHHNFERTPLVTRGPYDFHLADEVFGGGDGEALSDDVPQIPEPAPSAPSETDTADPASA